MCSPEADTRLVAAVGGSRTAALSPTLAHSRPARSIAAFGDWHRRRFDWDLLRRILFDSEYRAHLCAWDGLAKQPALAIGASHAAQPLSSAVVFDSLSGDR